MFQVLQNPPTFAFVISSYSILSSKSSAFHFADLLCSQNAFDVSSEASGEIFLFLRLLTYGSAILGISKPKLCSK